jgi:hypothetical protein
VEADILFAGESCRSELCRSGKESVQTMKQIIDHGIIGLSINGRFTELNNAIVKTNQIKVLDYL